MQKSRALGGLRGASLLVVVVSLQLVAWAEDKPSPAGKSAGARIKSVVPRTPAHAAGLQPGDTITKVDGKAIGGDADFRNSIRDAAAAGRELALTVIEAGTGKETVKKVRPSRIGRIGISALTFQPSTTGGKGDTAPRTQAELRKWVEQIVTKRKVRLPEPTFDWRGRSLLYRLNPLFLPDADEDLYEAPLSAQFTVAAIRQYRISADQRTFWRPVLAKVESEIAGMLKDIQARPTKDESVGDKLEKRQMRIDAIYQSALDGLAKREGKAGAMQIHEVKVYTISVRVTPMTGVLKYVRSGSWFMFLLTNSNREPKANQLPWKTAAPGSTVEVGQVTTFLAIWTDGGTRTETFDVAPNDGKTLVVDKRTGFAWKER